MHFPQSTSIPGPTYLPQDATLHRRLAVYCVDQLLLCLADENTNLLWRAKGQALSIPCTLRYTHSFADTAASYSSTPTSASFLSYFAGSTPDSDAKRTRLKAVLFLQGSALYDFAAVREKLVEAQADAAKGNVLNLELAIVEGKV